MPCFAGFPQVEEVYEGSRFLARSSGKSVSSL